MRMDDVVRILRENGGEMTTREIIDEFYGPGNGLTGKGIACKLNRYEKYGIVRRTGKRRSPGGNLAYTWVYVK